MQYSVDELENKARWVRRQVLDMAFSTGKGHIGGTYSCIDLLVALYYGMPIRLDSERPHWEDRDRFVIGKGHACLALYSILVDLGFIPLFRLKEYGSDGSSLGGQLNVDTPGVEYNTGSLGHALGIAAGMAMAAKLQHRSYRSFALVGDGEFAEGSIWETVTFAAQNRLNNLIGIIDRNRLSVTRVFEEDDGTGRLDERIRACGWSVRTLDGHSFESILAGLAGLDQLDRPLMVIADTIKGKGVSFMENGLKWHHSIPTRQEYDKACLELEAAR